MSTAFVINFGPLDTRFVVLIANACFGALCVPRMLSGENGTLEEMLLLVLEIMWWE